MKKFLVTGGGGFVGSHLVQKLIQNGDQVVIFDDFSTGNRKNLREVEALSNLTIIEGSILDEATVEQLVSKSDFIFHLAAAVGVFNIVASPLKSLSVNFRGSEIVISACIKHKKPFLVTSSSEIYGKNTAFSLSEDDDRILGSPLIGRWTYSEAKAVEEFMAFNAFQQHGIPAKIVRLFNTVGPRQSAKYGMVLPRFVKSALENQPIEIFGSGEQTRCFGHVLDVVDAIVSVAESSASDGQVYNVGNPKEISINELAKTVIEFTGSSSEIVYVKYQDAYGEGFEDMLKRVPNIDKIHKEVGWQPKRDLTQIIRDIVTFETNQN